MERRRVPRVNLSYDATMALQKKNILCSMKNLTSGGALLSVDKNYNAQISKNDVGKNVSLTLSFSSSEDRIFQGVIIRIDGLDDLRFVALQFTDHP